MSEHSKIEWTDHTANFWIWGPSKTTNRELKKGIWKELPKWNRKAEREGKRHRVFVQSMADFFEDHPQVTEWRNDALSLMVACHWLDFQILTKRPENIKRMTPPGWWLSDTAFPDNFWIGTSVENQEAADKRIPELLQTPAAVRFLSVEPLLGVVDLDEYLSYEWGEDNGGMFGDFTETNIHWVIVGGESGPSARPMRPEWARSLRDQCAEAGVPLFFKQWGAFLPEGQEDSALSCREGFGTPVDLWGNPSPQGMNNYSGWRVGKKAAGRLLDGREWSEFPTKEAA
jgi:protein gp37